MDQYVGRCARGLNHMYQTFAVSPNYFDHSEYDNLGQIIMKKGRVMVRGSDPFLNDLTASSKFLVYVCFAILFSPQEFEWGDSQEV